MILLILGVLLWAAAHLFKRLAPERRAQMGDKGKGAVALALLVSVVLMVIGYRTAQGPVWWGPSGATKGINNLLVLVAFYLFAAAGMKTRVARKLRHPQLIGFALWAVAHILPNGDLESLVLFGGLLLWALAEIIVINSAEGAYVPEGPEPAAKKDLMALAGGIVVFVVVALIHGWIGPWPFGA